MGTGGARGEQTITLPAAEDGTAKEYPVLFTNRAIAEAENRLGRGVVGIMQDFQISGAGGLAVKDVAILLHAGLEHGRRDAGTTRKQVTADLAFSILDQIGFAEAAKVVFEAVAVVLAYDPYSESEEDSDPGE